MATIFVPIPLEDQFKEADSVIHGIFKGSVSKKLPNEEIVTENTFKLLSKSGLDAGHIINEESFKVLTPGGVWQGLVYHIEGTPTFTKGEKVILLLQKGKYGFEVYGLGVGKYNIKVVDRRTIIYSSIFPNHKKLGNITVEDFNILLNKVYGEPLQRLKGKHYVYKKDEVKRDIASIKEVDQGLRTLGTEKGEEDGGSAPLGGILSFILMIVGIVYFLNKT